MAAVTGPAGIGSIALRPLLGGDLDRVEVLEDELFGDGAWPRAAYEAELATPGRRYLAAVDADGRMVGYAGIALGEDAEVMTIGVNRPWQRHGIGARLLAALLDEARRARARRVFLEVRASDAGAQRLYARAGFRPVGLRRGYYQPENADAVVMRLDLDRPGPIGAEVADSAGRGSGGHGSVGRGSVEGGAAVPGPSGRVG